MEFLSVVLIMFTFFAAMFLFNCASLQDKKKMEFDYPSWALKIHGLMYFIMGVVLLYLNLVY